MSRTTLQHVAREAGVSIRTASIALNGDPEAGRISPARVAAVRSIANRLKYRPNAYARATAGKRAKQIGVVVRNHGDIERFAHPYAYETLLGINEGLENHDYLATLVRVTDLDDEKALGSRAFREHLLDGVIVVGGLPAGVSQRIASLAPHCVWVEPQDGRERNAVTRDEVEAGRLAARAAASLGYCEAVFLQRFFGVNAPHLHGRREGFLQEAGQRGLAVQIVSASDWLDREAVDLGRDLAGDAVTVASDVYLARQLLYTATSLGLRPGHDTGIICCDDAFDVTRLWPGLSRSSFDRFAMGRRAARMIRDLIEKEEGVFPSVTLRGHWIPGDSAWGPR